MNTSQTNRRLALLALGLAGLALVAGSPLHSPRTTIDTKELAYKIEHELDHVTPAELEQWISSGKTDLRVIDLRSEEEFLAYHIPGSERMDLPTLVDTPLERNADIVVYSEGGVHSAQAMFLLWANGYTRVYMLKGGIRAWDADVLHGTSPTPTPQEPSTKKPNQLKEDDSFRREC